MRSSLILVALAALALGGCANTKTFRNLASVNAAVVNDYRSMLKASADRQSMLNADNERRLHDMEALQAEAQTETRQRLLALDLAGDGDASILAKLVTAKRAADVTGESRALAGLAAAPPPEPVTVDVSKVEALTKQLKELSEKPSRWDQLASGVAFAQALRDAYQATAAETQKQAGEADTAAKTLAAADKKAAEATLDADDKRASAK